MKVKVHLSLYVTVCLGGGNAEYVAAHEDQLMEIPSGMSFDTAAAIPETWLTAFQLLHTIGKLGGFISMIESQQVNRYNITQSLFN